MYILPTIKENLWEFSSTAVSEVLRWHQSTTTANHSRDERQEYLRLQKSSIPCWSITCPLPWHLYSIPSDPRFLSKTLDYLWTSSAVSTTFQPLVCHTCDSPSLSPLCWNPFVPLPCFVHDANCMERNYITLHQLTWHLFLLPGFHSLPCTLWYMINVK